LVDAAVVRDTRTKKSINNRKKREGKREGKKRRGTKTTAGTEREGRAKTGEEGKREGWGIWLKERRREERSRRGKRKGKCAGEQTRAGG
jgi:hypothetical protein